MDVNELDCYIEVYNTKIKPQIEKGNYAEAKTSLSGLLTILLTEQIERNISRNPIVYLPNAIANIHILIKHIEDKEVIDKESRLLETNLKQYRMRLEALAKSNS